MRRSTWHSTKLATHAAVMMFFLALPICSNAAPRAAGGSAGRVVGSSAGSAVFFSPGYGSGLYGGYGPSFYGPSSAPTAYSYLPNHWWTGYYNDVDPRGIGYNPSAGYDWSSVTTLLLKTFPAKARVTLDGIYVGTMDLLGPFQLPLGEHTLRIEAAGYLPSETVLKVEKAVVQQMSVRLSAIAHAAKTAPK